MSRHLLFYGKILLDEILSFRLEFTFSNLAWGQNIYLGSLCKGFEWLLPKYEGTFGCLLYVQFEKNLDDKLVYLYMLIEWWNYGHFVTNLEANLCYEPGSELALPVPSSQSLFFF